MDTRETFEGDYRSAADQGDTAKFGAEPPKPNGTARRLPLTGFIVLMLAGLLMCAGAIFIADAPLGGPVEDWISWARIETVASGVMSVGAIVVLIAIIGCIFRLTVPVKRRTKAVTHSPVTGNDDFDLAIPETELQVSGDGLKVASVHYLSAETPADPAVRNRASLRFEAPSATTQAGLSQSQAPRPPMSGPELIPHYGDNAADAFGLPKPHLASAHLTAEPAAVTPPRSVVDTGVLSPEHGLQISGLKPKPEPDPAPTAQVIPLRPEPLASEAPVSEPATVHDHGPVVYTEPQPEASEAVPVEAATDPIAAALLADAPETPGRDLPPSDINAVVTSAMRFIETPPETEGHDAYAPVAPTPVAAQVPDQPPVQAPAPATPMLTPEEEIGQAVSTALSVWPDTTRPIAAEELSVRISYLYYDTSAKSREVFNLIAAGDLSAAASRLQGMANELMNAGAFAQSAELWRVYGALHMGRDDPKAMMAYEQVSELDPSDANIHLYLARRYQMDGRTDVLAPVIGRALAVVSDPQTRSGLLTQYADLKFKVGDLSTAATAFEELSLINESLAYLDPSNLQVRSARGIALARLAQIREMQGEHPKAAPLYRKAHEVFAELSAQMPGHAGLKTMAENALRDVQRLGA